MALIRDFSLNGVHYPQAYSRIDATRVTAKEASIGMLTYATMEERLNGLTPVWSEFFYTDYATVAANVFPASYAFVKTQPGYQNAIDHDDPPEAPAVVVIDPNDSSDNGLPNDSSDNGLN